MFLDNEHLRFKTIVILEETTQSTITTSNFINISKMVQMNWKLKFFEFQVQNTFFGDLQYSRSLLGP